MSKSRIKIFTEIGYGNPSFISTEVEKGAREHRIKGFVRMKVFGVYLRIWVGHKVFIASSEYGFSITTKPKRKFKFILGFYGTRK